MLPCSDPLSEPPRRRRWSARRSSSPPRPSAISLDRLEGSAVGHRFPILVSWNLRPGSRAPHRV